MKCTIVYPKGGATYFVSGVVGLSVGQTGSQAGELVLITAGSFSSGNVERIKREDWDRVLITKDFSWERAE